jgi:predicted DNA-binding ribbon-helix-helix protein
MKKIVLKIDDDAYRRAEGIANARKISMSALVEELVESLTNNAQPNSDDITNLFSALDKGRNTKPIGRLGRQELFPS